MVTGLILLVLLLAVGWINRDSLREWVVFALRFERLGTNAQGFPEYRHRATGIVMVRIPGGTFPMGTRPRMDGVGTAEEPQHEVTLSSFLIGKYEVTQAEWSRILGANPSPLKGDDLPVHAVSWEECRVFCEKAGLRLPTEAQWEFACRAGDVDQEYGSRPAFDGRIPQLYVNGQRADGMTVETLDEFARALDGIAWFGENSGDKPHPVGEKRPNGFGLHDTIGNVFEWCEDVYDRGFYSRPEASGVDPLCTSGGDRRVGRGGCYWKAGELYNHRSSYRFPFAPTGGEPFLGLRAALPLR